MNAVKGIVYLGNGENLKNFNFFLHRIEDKHVNDHCETFEVRMLTIKWRGRCLKGRKMAREEFEFF